MLSVMIHVCPLSRLSQTVQLSGARHVVSLINTSTLVPRPPTVPDAHHLMLGMNDITEHKEGHVLPDQVHVMRLIEFVKAWDQKSPMVIHCWAGVSRSPAAAFVAMCGLFPHLEEEELARKLRQASPTATPNARIIALADELLARQGRMITAISRIGRGEDTFEGKPFQLEWL